MNKVIGISDESNFVRHEFSVIQDGKYGQLRMDKESKTQFFVPLGSAVYIKSYVCCIDDFSKSYVLEITDATNQIHEIDFNREDLTETRILILVKYGVQVNKKSAPILIETLENQEPVVGRELIHKRLGFSEYMGERIFRGKEASGVASKYMGKKDLVKGSFVKWRKLAKELVENSPCMATIFLLAMSSVTIDFFKQYLPIENILVHLIGESTTGKTTATLFAVSTGSSPATNEDGFLLSFADTKNSLMYSINSSFPCCIDEASMFYGNPTKLLYSMASGTDKRRLKMTDNSFDVEDPNKFNTTIFFTSEKSLLDMADENSGLLVRNLEFNGVQWTESAQQAEHIQKVVTENYGFAVPIFAEYLLNLSEDEIKQCVGFYHEHVQEMIEHHRSNGIDNAFVSRVCKMYALLLLTDDLLANIEDLAFDTDLDSIVNFLLENSLIQRADVSIGVRALEYILQVVQNDRSIIDTTAGCELSGSDCQGVIRKTDKANVGKHKVIAELCITEHHLDELLEQANFHNTKIIVNEWKRQGILHHEEDRLTRRVTLGKVGKVKCYCVYILDEDSSKKEKKPIIPKRKDIS